MKRVALIGVMVALMQGAASGQERIEEPQPLVCVPPAQTRELFFQDKLVPPFRVMREAAVIAQAEAIDIQLCRFQSGLVYDVTLLGRDGRVIHRLIAATTGVPLGRPPPP